MTTIVLAEDHPVVREGLRRVLEAEKDIQVIGETGDGTQVVWLVARAQPDVLVLDLMMPGCNGLVALRQVKQSAPRTRVVILSMHANEAYVSDALEAGASAYVLKQSDSAELVRAIHAVRTGACYLSPPLSANSIAAFAEQLKASGGDLFHALTTRERQVLQLIAEGRVGKEIAKVMNISRKTVENHRSNLMAKLDVHDTAGLTRVAIKHGLVALEE